VLDVQYHCQHHFFGRMARAYFDNQKRDDLENRQRASKYDQCYEQLPETFTVQDIVSGYGVTPDAAGATASRLCKNGYVERLKHGQYRKLKHSLL
jgi:predicted transcriptional regulator of viral defense system